MSKSLTTRPRASCSYNNDQRITLHLPFPIFGFGTVLAFRTSERSVWLKNGKLVPSASKLYSFIMKFENLSIMFALSFVFSATAFAAPPVILSCKSASWFSSTNLTGAPDTAGKTLASTLAKNSGPRHSGLGVWRGGTKLYTTGNGTTVWAGRHVRGSMVEAQTNGTARIKVLSEMVQKTSHCHGIAVLRTYKAKLLFSYFDMNGNAEGTEEGDFDCLAPIEERLDYSNCPG